MVLACYSILKESGGKKRAKKDRAMRRQTSSHGATLQGLFGRSDAGKRGGGRGESGKTRNSCKIHAELLISKPEYSRKNVNEESGRGEKQKSKLFEIGKKRKLRKCVTILRVFGRGGSAINVEPFIPSRGRSRPPGNRDGGTGTKSMITRQNRA